MTETLLVIGLIFGILVLLYHKVKAWLLAKSAAALTEQIKEKKDEAEQKVTDANVAYESFMQRLREYRAKGKR